MQENHQREQYWYDEATLRRLSQLVWQYRKVVGLCCPMLGKYMADRGYHPPLVLDIDTRFVGNRWFRPWNIHDPKPLEFHPDLVVVDPPFFTIKLDRLWAAMGRIVEFDYTTPLVVSWPKRREAALLGTFAHYNLKPTGLKPGYVSCSPDVEFYANFDLRGALCLGPEDTL